MNLSFVIVLVTFVLAMDAEPRARLVAAETEEAVGQLRGRLGAAKDWLKTAFQDVKGKLPGKKNVESVELVGELNNFLSTMDEAGYVEAEKLFNANGRLTLPPSCLESPGEWGTIRGVAIVASSGLSEVCKPAVKFYWGIWEAAKTVVGLRHLASKHNLDKKDHQEQLAWIHVQASADIPETNDPEQVKMKETFLNLIDTSLDSRFPWKIVIISGCVLALVIAGILAVALTRKK